MRTPSTWALLGGMALSVLLAVTLLGQMLAEHQRAMDDELRQHVLYARVLEDHVTRSIETTAHAVAALPGVMEGRVDAARLGPTLPQVLAGLPQLRSLALLDAQGRVLASSDPDAVGLRIELGRLGRLPDAGADLVGPALPGRGLASLVAGQAPDAPPGVSFIPLLRRTATPAGQALLLVAAMNPEGLANHLRLVLDAPDSQAFLASYAGDLMTGTSVPASGGDLLAMPVFSAYLPQREHASYVGVGVGGQPDQLVAFRVSRSRALLVIVQRPRHAATEAWLHKARWRIGLGAVAVLLVAGMAALVSRSLQGRESARARLDEQLAFSASLLEISPLPTFMVDARGRYLSVNQAWEAFTGRQGPAVIGQVADPLPAPSRGQAGEPRYETRLRAADGTVRDMVVNQVVVAGPHGRPGGVLRTLMDVSELRQAERVTREARDQAEETSRAKSEFIANISHELRTPLQAIIGFSELGMVRSRAHESLAGMFRDVHTSGQRMLLLVNDLLDVSSIECEAGTLHMERTDLRPLVREVLRELAPPLSQHRLHVEWDAGESALVAKVDPPRFQQVIRHLLANAIKFSPPGSVIDLAGGLTAEGEVHWTLRDRGHGIPPPELEKVFEAFVQSTRTKDGSGGSGLGLAICRKIVEAHGGRIHAENMPDGGCRFHLRLPSRGVAETRPAALDAAAISPK